jgi:hypothetical protein
VISPVSAAITAIRPASRLQLVTGKFTMAPIPSRNPTATGTLATAA